jgi:hypothetical protein
LLLEQAEMKPAKTSAPSTDVACAMRRSIPGNTRSVNTNLEIQKCHRECQSNVRAQLAEASLRRRALFENPFGATIRGQTVVNGQYGIWRSTQAFHELALYAACSRYHRPPVCQANTMTRLLLERSAASSLVTRPTHAPGTHFALVWK